MRIPRKIKENVFYHVVARANRKEFIFNTTEIKEMFILVLKKAKKKYSFQIKNFCIMDNHIHLLIKPGENINLSKIMQWILSVFAIRYNKKYGYIGHVWYDRFKSSIIENLKEFINTYKYIANNPVAAKIVKKVQNYYYCGINYKKFEFIDPPDKLEEKLLKYFFNDVFREL
ncbi:MAG: transposase [Spirochaetales bacterium]|nr:transposase [Spirochaetales bacterium]